MGQELTAVVIPVKSFDLAKERLSGALGSRERAELAKSMAAGVVAAGRPLPTFVVCGDAAVAAWAGEVGAQVIWLEQPGLNLAVSFACGVLASEGYRRAIIAHGDLPLARSLAWVAEFDGVTIVPDRRGQGTNVMAVPLDAEFGFHYGEGSAAAHRAEAERRGLPLRIMADDSLGWDVDTPSDLADLPDVAHVPDPAHVLAVPDVAHVSEVAEGSEEIAREAPIERPEDRPVTPGRSEP